MNLGPLRPHRKKDLFLEAPTSDQARSQPGNFFWGGSKGKLWRGKTFLFTLMTVARELFLDRGQDRERQNRVHERNVFAGIAAFFLSRKQAFFKKRSSPDLERFCPENKRFSKKVFAGFGAFSCSKTGSEYRSQEGIKSRPGRAKIFPEGVGRAAYRAYV